MSDAVFQVNQMDEQKCHSAPPPTHTHTHFDMSDGAGGGVTAQALWFIHTADSKEEFIIQTTSCEACTTDVTAGHKIPSLYLSLRHHVTKTTIRQPAWREPSGSQSDLSACVSNTGRDFLLWSHHWSWFTASAVTLEVKQQPGRFLQFPTELQKGHNAFLGTLVPSTRWCSI